MRKNAHFASGGVLPITWSSEFPRPVRPGKPTWPAGAERKSEQTDAMPNRLDHRGQCFGRRAPRVTQSAIAALLFSALLGTTMAVGFTPALAAPPRPVSFPDLGDGRGSPAAPAAKPTTVLPPRTTTTTGSTTTTTTAPAKPTPFVLPAGTLDVVAAVTADELQMRSLDVYQDAQLYLREARAARCPGRQGV